jgi:hypothetical protein
MGGYVARLTPILHPETRPFLRDIITLATPHANPLYAWDETVYTVHQRLLQEEQQHEQQQQNRNENEILIVSLSGGLRDEMIAPLSCDASLRRTSISVRLLLVYVCLPFQGYFLVGSFHLRHFSYRFLWYRP